MSTFTLVFKELKFTFLAIGIFSCLLFALLITSEHIFLEPYIVGQITSGTEFSFVLIITVSAMSGIVISMNVYRLKLTRDQKNKFSGSLAGSTLGVIAGACGCGPIGFALISTFGSGAGVVFAFLTDYSIPLRIISLLILGIFYYTTTRSITQTCMIR